MQVSEEGSSPTQSHTTCQCLASAPSRLASCRIHAPNIHIKATSQALKLHSVSLAQEPAHIRKAPPTPRSPTLAPYSDKELQHNSLLSLLQVNNLWPHPCASPWTLHSRGQPWWTGLLTARIPLQTRQKVWNNLWHFEAFACS